MRRRLQGKMPPIPIHTTPYAVSVEPSNLSNSDSTIISVEAETQNSLNTPKRFAYSELGRRPCGRTDSLDDSSCPLCPISYTSVLPQIEPTQIVTLVASPNAGPIRGRSRFELPLVQSHTRTSQGIEFISFRPARGVCPIGLGSITNCLDSLTRIR